MTKGKSTKAASPAKGKNHKFRGKNTAKKQSDAQVTTKVVLKQPRVEKVQAINSATTTQPAALAVKEVETTIVVKEACEVQQKAIAVSKPDEVPVKAKKERKRKEMVLPSLDSNWKKLRSMLPEPKKPKVQEASENSASRRVIKYQVISTATLSKEDEANLPLAMKRKVVALDCEMVGGEKGESLLARVCLIDESGGIIYDKFVRPQARILDYRTKYSGIRPHNLSSPAAITFDQAQREVAELIQGSIVVGHSVKNDFQSLCIEHPAHLIRDTAKFHAFKSTSGHARKLKHLALERLQRVIQDGQKGHDPADDAKASLDLYLKHRHEWELSIQKARARGPMTVV